MTGPTTEVACFRADWRRIVAATRQPTKRGTKCHLHRVRPVTGCFGRRVAHGDTPCAHRRDTASQALRRRRRVAASATAALAFSATGNAAVSAPHFINVFPSRDFVHLEGYNPGQDLTVTVHHDPALITSLSNPAWTPPSPARSAPTGSSRSTTSAGRAVRASRPTSARATRCRSRTPCRRRPRHHGRPERGGRTARPDGARHGRGPRHRAEPGRHRPDVRARQPPDQPRPASSPTAASATSTRPP